jgi:FAD/FMN-containing dehydrogenase
VDSSITDEFWMTGEMGNLHKHKFIAQSGGHWFLFGDDVIMNLRAMNKVKGHLEQDAEEGIATLSAGCLTGEVLEAAHAAGAHIMTGVCNTVGVVSALIGGGLRNLVSLYGLGVDNMLSAKLVTASGEVVTVSEKENADLWWGLRGAGYNFGIFSELTVKAYK